MCDRASKSRSPRRETRPISERTTTALNTYSYCNKIDAVTFTETVAYDPVEIMLLRARAPYLFYVRENIVLARRRKRCKRSEIRNHAVMTVVIIGITIFCFFFHYSRGQNTGVTGTISIGSERARKLLSVRENFSGGVYRTYCSRDECGGRRLKL